MSIQLLDLGPSARFQNRGHSPATLKATATAPAALKSREFDHRLSFDRFQTGTKPARRAFQQGNDGTCAPALAVEKGDETLQQPGQIVPGADLERNRPDGRDNELAART